MRTFGKILHISPEPPDVSSGGKLGVLQTSLSLSGICDQLDYVGPEIPLPQIKGLYHEAYELEPSGNALLRVIDSFKMCTNRRYRSWLNLDLDFSSYDAVILEFTKLHYVPDRLDRNVPLYVRVHNVEPDYSRNVLKRDKSAKAALEYYFSKKREKTLVEAATKVVALTEKDRARLLELYEVPSEKIALVPVCVERRDALSAADYHHDDLVRLLITGSLWYGSNADGVKWFVENVFAHLGPGFQLTVAGSNPSMELVDFLHSAPEVSLVESPPDMDPLFREANIVVAPIFDGAGMKAKVAEALSYGKYVVGTAHAFIGYDIEQGVNSYRAEDASAFIAALEGYRRLSEEEKRARSIAAADLHRRCYSIESSKERWMSILRGAVEGSPNAN